MIRKLKSGKYRLYSEKKDPKTGKRKNLGTFDTREVAIIETFLRAGRLEFEPAEPVGGLFMYETAGKNHFSCLEVMAE